MPKKKPAKTSHRHRFIKDIANLPYYAKLPKNYKWPYLREKRNLDEEVRLEDFGIELRSWQLGALQLASMVLLFLLNMYFVKSIFNNPPSGRHQFIHTVLDALLLNYIRHTLLSNLSYIILLYIGLALLTKVVFLFWRYLYVNGKQKGWPDTVLTLGTILYFGFIYVGLPTYMIGKIGLELYRADVRLLAVYILSWFLIYPYATLGTYTVLAKKAKTAYALLTINLILMIMSWLLIFNLISEDIQQDIFLPSIGRMMPALMFGIMFGAYLIVTRQYIIYKFRMNYTVDRFDERLKENKRLKNQYLGGLSRTLTKSLVRLLITCALAALLTVIPVAFLYKLVRGGPYIDVSWLPIPPVRWFLNLLMDAKGPFWMQQSYELNSVYGLILPFLIVLLALMIGRSVYELARERLDARKVDPVLEPEELKA